MSTKPKRAVKRKPQYFAPRDLSQYILEEAEKTGKSKQEILEETFHDGYVVISESGDGAFKVESGQLFKDRGEKIDDLTECRRLRERFGPIAACIDYIKDLIMGSGYDVVVEDFHDKKQREVQEEIEDWMVKVYQDAYTVGLNHLLDILVDNALTEGFSAAEIVFAGEEGDLFNKYAKPLTTSIASTEGGKLGKADYTSYEISDPNWVDLKGIARLKIFIDAPTRLRLMRKGRSWEADYWILDQPNVAGSNVGGSMATGVQKNLQTATTMQFTSEDLVRSTLPNTKQTIAKPSAYFLPWQIFALSLSRRNWLEKGPSIILPAMKTAQLLEKIMNAVGEGIYRAGNKKYFIICTAEGTLVWTPEGYRKIETIQVGDKVWGKDGPVEVLQTFKNPYKGEIYEIKPELLETVSFTPNHPVKIASKVHVKKTIGQYEPSKDIPYSIIKEYGKDYINGRRYEIKEGYTRADELTTNDYLVVPKMKESRDIWIDFPQVGKNSNSIPSQYLSEDLAKLFGWYLSEGVLTNEHIGSHYSIRFCLNKTEPHYAQEILDLLKTTLGLYGRISDYPTSLVVEVNSKSFVEFLEKWFGHSAGEKHLPEGFIYWKPEILNAMISRIVMGDGHIAKNHWIKLKLNSYELQKQLQIVLMKLGHRASFYKVHRNPISYIQGRQINQHDAWVLDWKEDNRTICEDEENYYFRIKKITKKPYEGYVYNLHTTAGEYYLPFQSFNCGSKDRPWGAIHIRNLLSQIKDASEKNWSTIPVPAGFDLKEAGGTVFEAQNAINYFLRIIAGIMHVNPSVLGLDTREARNITEYPYFTHQRMKDELRNQIRTQLIRLHIWAKYGQKVSKQGGYMDPQWIPKLRVKTEDLLNPSDRLKLDIDILNAANPVMPQTKLEVERDIVKTRGWEVDLPTQEEYMADLKKKEEENKKVQEKPVEQPAEKTMGSPSPPSEEKQQKRLEAGVNTNKGGSKPNAPRGSTRKPAEVQESEAVALTNDTRYRAIKIKNNEQGLATSFHNPFTAKEVEIVRVPLSDGIAGFNEDETKIYIDPDVPDWMILGLIAHESFEQMLINLGFSYDWSHIQATQVEKMLCKDLGIDYEKYNDEYFRLIDVQSKRDPKPKDPKDIHHGYHHHSHKTTSKKKKVEESKPQEPQKVDVNINVTTKAEPLIVKTEKQEVDITIKEGEKKPIEPTKVELTIKNEPVTIKSEKQEIEIKLKEDEEKKAEEKEIRKKKKDLLDKMDKKLEEGVE